MTSDGQPYHRWKYKQIIEEQVALGYLTKGGVTYHDSEEMSPHERHLALEAIKEILKSQSEENQRLLNNARVSQDNSAPKSGMHH